MYLFCRQYLHFDVSTWDGNLVGRKYERTLETMLPTSSFHRWRKNMKKSFLMFTCCCLHIALDCALCSGNLLQPTSSGMIYPIEFIDLHNIFTISRVLLVRKRFSINFPGPSYEVLTWIIYSNLSEKMFVRWCKAIYHCSIIMLAGKKRKPKLDSLNLINLVALSHLQFPLISCCHRVMCVGNFFLPHCRFLSALLLSFRWLRVKNEI